MWKGREHQEQKRTAKYDWMQMGLFVSLTAEVLSKMK